MHKEGIELSRIQHPGIVTIHDIGNDERGVWIVTEYLDGETARTRLKREKRLSLERTVAIVHQMAAAVAVAHSRGIIHGDLKPENTFLNDDNVKIVDFLTARILTMGEDDAVRDTFAYATAEYAAPECFDQDGDPDARSDIYSLAIIFIEFFTGQNPMLPDGKPVFDALLRLRQRDFSPPVPAEIPTPLAQVLLRALEKKPSKRQQSMLDFASELERAWKHVLRSVDEVQPTWYDRWRPLLPSIAAGISLGASFGLLAFVLRHAPGRIPGSLLDAHLESATMNSPPRGAAPIRPSPASIGDRGASEAASARAVSAMVTATATVQDPAAVPIPSVVVPAAAPPPSRSLPPATPEPTVVVKPRNVAPLRPKPPRAHPVEPVRRHPLEISDELPF